MKKKYNEPIIEIEKLDCKDVIITSETTTENFNSPFDNTDGNTKPWKW